jgi:hypothetical protein
LPKALYAQCSIYYELRQVAHFLARLGSFHEATQIQLIHKLGGQHYFDPQKPDKPTVLLNKVKQRNDLLWQAIPEGYRIGRSGESGHKKLMPLGNRYAKRDYINALIAAPSDSISPTQLDVSAWQRLDFWYGIRNRITHGSKGVSLERVQEVYENRYEELPENPSEEQLQELDSACSYTEILDVMENILTIISPGVDENHDDYQTTDYYIYSMIRDWSIAQLKSSD